MGILGTAESHPIPTWKRAVDLGLLLLLLPAIVVFLVGISLLIKAVSRGPVFFVQERVGYRGKVFRLYKFRTMRPDCDPGVHREHLARLMRSDQPMAKLDTEGDRRLIPLGRLLRASGLDELPQLINVLKGQMSVIGPRPATTYEYALYRPWHQRRLEVLPGLTGLWQVSGKNHTTFDEMIKLDIYYAQHLSWWLDAKILVLTLPVLVRQVTDRPAAAARRPSGAMSP